MNESELIAQAKRGNLESLALLLREHYSLLRHYVLKLTMNPVLTDDIVQDTMLRSMEKLYTYDGSSKFSSWLITIATRIYMDMLRRNKVEQRWQEQAARAMRFQMESDRMEWSETLDQLSRLTPEHRAALVLKHYYGYTYSEIASMMKCSEGTIKSRVYYAMQELRKEDERDEQQASNQST